MENTIENKARFFAQYWGQQVLSDGICFDALTVNAEKMSSSYKIENHSLCLKPLSSITDEDAIKSCELAYNLSFTYEAKWYTYRDNEIGFVTIKSKGSHHSFDLDFNSGIVEQYQDEFNRTENIMDHYAVCDFLRSKGYALPYMGLYVEQLIEYGWIKFSSTT